MKLNKNITLEQALEYIGINYSDVLENIVKLAEKAQNKDDFIKSFSKYFEEKGLGDDDKYESSLYILDLFIKEDSKHNYKVNDLIIAKGNSGFTYQGKIKEIIDENTFNVLFERRDGNVELILDRSYIVE